MLDQGRPFEHGHRHELILPWSYDPDVVQPHDVPPRREAVDAHFIEVVFDPLLRVGFLSTRNDVHRDAAAVARGSGSKPPAKAARTQATAQTHASGARGDRIVVASHYAYDTGAFEPDRQSVSHEGSALAAPAGTLPASLNDQIGTMGRRTASSAE